MAESLRVSKQPDGHPEIFHSIQGEGVNVGRPAVFLRLGLCNLACTWCDTKYTWDWKRYDPKSQIVEMSPEEVEREVMRCDCRYVVVTGGEPMIQQRQLIPLLRRLKDLGHRVEIETNGTIVPASELVGLADHWSVSPKLGNSGNPSSLREVAEAYRFFGCVASSHFKYVIQNEDDIAEVEGMVRKYGLAHERVILMPEAKDREALLERGVWLVEHCKRHGYLFSTRLQVLLWGGRRGV